MNTHAHADARTTTRRGFCVLRRLGALLFVVGVAWILSRLSQSPDDQSSPPETVEDAAYSGSNRIDKAITPAASGTVLSPQQVRGREIYRSGTSARGNRMTAILGNSTTEIPAGVLACVNCHRYDGRGKPEGGITPSDISWAELTRPYGSTGPLGNSRPPYDETSLVRAIAMGIDAAGRTLDPAMPRYRMAHSDMDDLIKYLRALGNELDPGLSTESIRIGMVLPPRTPFAEMSDAIRAVATAYVAEVNEQGGIYQRQIELCFSEAPRRPEDRGEALIRFVTDDRLFALCGSFIAGAEDEVGDRLASEGVPLIGAQCLYPVESIPPCRYLFYLSAGLFGQGRALAAHAISRRGTEDGPVAILCADDSQLEVVSAQIEQCFAESEVPVTKHHVAPAASREVYNSLVNELRSSGSLQVLLLLPDARSLAVVESAQSQGWSPDYFLPGSLAGPEIEGIGHGFQGHIFLSFPTWPLEQKAGMQAYVQLARDHRLQAEYLTAQFEILAALETLTHGLQQAGAKLTREQLIEELEPLYEFQCRFAPPVSFGPNRRIGHLGASVVELDAATGRLAAVASSGGPTTDSRGVSKAWPLNTQSIDSGQDATLTGARLP